MRQGTSKHWDCNPPSDASQQNVRNRVDWTVVANRYRDPRLKDDAQ